jgi:hypothetical protein
MVNEANLRGAIRNSFQRPMIFEADDTSTVDDSGDSELDPNLDQIPVKDLKPPEYILATHTGAGPQGRTLKGKRVLVNRAGNVVAVLASDGGGSGGAAKTVSATPINTALTPLAGGGGTVTPTTTTPTDTAAAGGFDIMGILTMPIGPLPLWIWGVGGLAAYFIFFSGKKSR